MLKATDAKRRCCNSLSSSTTPAFRELRAETGWPLPGHVQEESEAYLNCGQLEEGFLRVQLQ